MRHNSSKTILWLLLLFIVISCRQEDTLTQIEERNVKGRIVLSLSDIEVFTSDAETRAALDDYSGFVFTLNGTTVEGETVRDRVITFTNNAAIIDAGKYSLSANNDAASVTGNGCANYSGTTTENFTLTVGGSTTVSISMGAPKNARVTLEQAESFSTRYTDVRVTLTAGSRSIDLGNATGCEAEAFFPAGTIDYTVTAAAKQGSHVTDISSASGTVTLTAGKHHVISLTANPATGEIIPLIEGTHTGEFD